MRTGSLAAAPAAGELPQPAIRRGSGAMISAAVIIGVIGALIGLALGAYEHLTGSFAGAGGIKAFVTDVKVVAVVAPLAALCAAVLVRASVVIGGLVLIASAVPMIGLVAVNSVNLLTIGLLATAGATALLAEGARSADGRVSNGAFWLLVVVVTLALLAATRLYFTNEYFFFAAYVVLQYAVLSTAWNILGGYTGYTNFGVGAFFAGGAYCSVVLHKLTALPLPVMIGCAGLVAALIGLGVGYLTLRLKGVFFAIATLALAIVVQTLITNWDFVGGSRGIYIIRPQMAPLGGGYIQYLYTLMMFLTAIAIGIARAIERSRLGLGFAAIRDDEGAAEAAGVPTLRLKLIATSLSGALMGMAGAPMPYYVTYLDPASSFNLAYAVNSVAMPVVGGMTSWIGPIIGAVLLGTIQQVATVTISSAVNLLIVGLLLIGFVIIAPNGIVGLVTARRRARERR